MSMDRNRKVYILKEHLFSVGNTKDVDYKLFGKTLAEFAAERFGGEIVDCFPSFSEGETLVVLRSSHTCLPRTGVEALVKKAEKSGENLFFGAGWVMVERAPVLKAKYDPLYGGATFLSLVDLPFVSEAIRTEIVKKLLKKGVVVENATGVFVDATAVVESGAYLSHDVTVKGKSVIRSGARIEPYTVVEDSYVGENASVGPFARLRQNANIGEGCRVGNFTEVKNAVFGKGTKAAHLAYVGDAELGKNCNVGCGAVFVNYDGRKKHKTTVGDRCFIGSNANLIAPVRMADGSFLAAGSTLTKNLAEGDLCVARERERIMPSRAKRYYDPQG